MEGLETLKCVRGARRRGCVDVAAVLTRWEVPGRPKKVRR